MLTTLEYAVRNGLMVRMRNTPLRRVHCYGSKHHRSQHVRWRHRDARDSLMPRPVVEVEEDILQLRAVNNGSAGVVFVPRAS